MKLRKLHAIAAALLAASAALHVAADTVTLQDGSVIHGTITAIGGGRISIDTGFAGSIQVDQSKVVSFATDKPVYVKTGDGAVALGTVEPAPEGIRVTGAASTLTTPVASVSAGWGEGQEDPVITALRRHWTYEAALDIAGKTGNSDRFAAGAGFVATNKGPTDTLKLYAAANFAEDGGARSEDSLRGGVDFNSFFSERWSWYVGTEIGRDAVRDLELRVKAVAGFGYTAIKKADQDLQFRGGFSYRYETYDTGNALVDESLETSSPGLQFSLIHRLDIPSWGSMSNLINYTPSFDDLGNYVIFHDSSLTMPLGGSPRWGFRIGVSNEYISETAPGRDPLDTLYYARLVLNWR